uniref:ODAD1 central coiled coil region domain-containing protein n=1 Tax=Graphocephala atropunctata TaxID=36148 RepID=A0A1B6LB33_9HEMI
MPPKVAIGEMNEEEMKLKQKLMDQMELKKLIREDRLMRNTSTKDEATEKQEKVIAALTKQKDELVKNLNVMQNRRRCVMDAKQTTEINELFGQGDSLAMDIVREKRFIEDLDFQIRKESNELECRRRNTKRNFSASEYRQQKENQRADRAIDSWKTKLHVEQVQLSSAINENAELRKRMQQLFKSKSHFNELFEELVHKLDKGKRIMKDIVEQSQIQLKKRDEVARKIQALKERDEADMKKRQEEMQDLEMRLADDNNLTRFRNMVMHVRMKLSEGDKATKKAAAQRLLQEQELQELRDTWKAVKEATELEKCSDVCDLLTRQEAENFSLFNYNNELHDQLETMTERTAELLRKVDEEQENTVIWEDTEETERIQLENQLERLENEHSDKKDMCEASYRLFTRLLSKLRSLFEIAQCDPWPLEDLLGDNVDVTQFNYGLYLELLESRLMQWLGVCPRPDVFPQYGLGVSFITSVMQNRQQSGVLDRKEISRPCLDCDISNQTKQVIRVVNYL